MRTIVFGSIFSIISFCAFSQAAGTGGIDSAFANVNSPYDEQNPVLTPDGQNLYFTRGNHPMNTGGTKDQGDVWFAKLDTDGQWLEPEKVANVNNNQWNGLIGFSPDGRTAYLHSNAQRGISMSKKTAQGWAKPEDITIPYFKNHSKHQSACISRDGNIILFAIESFGGMGAEDIYVSFKKANDKWTEPKNLGSAINTPFQEMTPYLAEDNKTLYFSSNGRGGYGSSDVFVTRRKDDSWKNWTKPVNIGSKINTNGRELYYSYDTKKELARYVSIQNSDGYGDLKLKSFKPDDDLLPKEDSTEVVVAQIEVAPVEEVVPTETIEKEESIDDTPVITEEKMYFKVQGKVKDAHTNVFLGAQIAISEENDNYSTKAVSEADQGTYDASLPAAGTYNVQVSAPGYMTMQTTLEITQTDQKIIEQDYDLQPLKVGETVNLKHVLFQRSTANLLEGSYQDLDLVVLMMKENPNIEIELAGHTDNRGSGRINLKLSKERVETVKKYLVEQGIAAKRIEGKGYGGTRPIANNANEATRKLNRRVEFTIVKN